MAPISFNDLTFLPNHPEIDKSAPVISKNGSSISFVTNATSDWWRTPTEHRYSGPVLGKEVSSTVLEQAEWSVGVSLRGDWKDEYDQAALFLYQTNNSWIKTGIEFTQEKPWLSAVVNNPYSDWNLLPYPASSSALSPTPFTSFKISRAGTFVRIYVKLPEYGWTMVREVTNFLKDGEKVFIGVMGCSPKGQGVKVEFEDFWVE
ncbi:hypothetical protein BDY24DRAFT_396644 [Mrakia frigida]|uniref:Ree1p n=1 Tax=Mrakia frigida TaxID=29902 RepID=UPI003FCC0B57